MQNDYTVIKLITWCEPETDFSCTVAESSASADAGDAGEVGHATCGSTLLQSATCNAPIWCTWHWLWVGPSE